MKVVVIGASGQLGSDLCRVLPDVKVIPLTHADVEITDMDNENVKKIAGWSESDWQELVEENLMRDSTTTKDLF